MARSAERREEQEAHRVHIHRGCSRHKKHKRNEAIANRRSNMPMSHSFSHPFSTLGYEDEYAMYCAHAGC